MSKKLFFGMFAVAGMLMATSCSNDNPGIEPGNENVVTFNIGLENDMATRAISDGTGADKLVYAVFDNTGNRISTIEKVEKTSVTFPTNETLTLAKGNTYQVVFWAQDADCDAYTLTDDMNLTVDYAKANNDETRDAFYKKVSFTVNGNQSVNVEMKRPFAQVNVGVTAEDWNAAVASGATVTTSAVTMKQAASKMNLRTGAVSEPVDVEYIAANIPNETLFADTDFNGTNEEYHWLSMGYILANDTESVDGSKRALCESLEYTFNFADGKKIVLKNGLTNVPVQRNWRTNIVGKFLTGDVDFNISINPDYDGVAFCSTEADLKAIAATGGDAILTGDIAVASTISVSNKELTVHLNGHKINSSNPNDGVFMTSGTAVLNIEGDGEINAIKNNAQTDDDYAMAIWATGNSEVNIYGGNFYNKQTNTNTQLDLIYADSNAVVNIYGGRFESACHNTKTYWVLNLKDNSNAKINVFGGTFVNFNPAQAQTEPQNPYNFVANGYKSTQTGENTNIWVVTKDE